MKYLIVSAVAALLAGGAQAATLDFSGAICDGGTPCSNGEHIDQSYGDLVGVDVQYDARPDTAGLQDLSYWFDQYGDLLDVAYSGNGATIGFTASAGYDVFLDSLDLAGWPFANRVLGFTVTDQANNSLLFGTPPGAIAPGSGHAHYDLGLSSSVGLKVTFLGDFFTGGVDNLAYRAEVERDTHAVPLPATAWLLGAGLIGLALRGRPGTPAAGT